MCSSPITEKPKNTDLPNTSERGYSQPDCCSHLVLKCLTLKKYCRLLRIIYYSSGNMALLTNFLICDFFFLLFYLIKAIWISKSHIYYSINVYSKLINILTKHILWYIFKMATLYYLWCDILACDPRTPGSEDDIQPFLVAPI